MKKHRRRSQLLGRDSSREFYLVVPPTPFQMRQGVEEVHTRGPFINMQWKEMDIKSNEQCKRQTVSECGICWQHLKIRHYLRIKKSTIMVDNKLIGNGLFAITTPDLNQIIFESGGEVCK